MTLEKEAKAHAIATNNFSGEYTIKQRRLKLRLMLLMTLSQEQTQ